MYSFSNILYIVFRVYSYLQLITVCLFRRLPPSSLLWVFPVILLHPVFQGSFHHLGQTDYNNSNVQQPELVLICKSYFLLLSYVNATKVELIKTLLNSTGVSVLSLRENKTVTKSLWPNASVTR